MIRDYLRQLFHIPKDYSFSFVMLDFIFRRIFRQNAGVNWPVHHSSTIRCPEKIKKGRGVWPGDSPNVYINAMNGIAIGDYSNIGPNVSIISANHDFIDNAAHIASRSISIGNYCWIGASATILPEVILGDFTVVGAGAVVTKSFEEGYCVLAGNPARIIKQLNKESCLSFAASKEQ